MTKQRSRVPCGIRTGTISYTNNCAERVALHYMGERSRGRPPSINNRVAAGNRHRNVPTITLAPHQIWSTPSVIEI